MLHLLQKAISEDCVCEPWTLYAQYKWRVEQELSNIADLNYVVVRPAVIYGPGDRTGLSTFNVLLRRHMVYVVWLPTAGLQLQAYVEKIKRCFSAF